MIRNKCQFILTVIALIWFLAMSFAEEDGNAAKYKWSDYEILITRNIFSKNRVKFIPRTSRNFTAPRQQSYTYYLRGIAINAGQDKRAFVEDAIRGEYHKLKIGEKVAGRIVKNIEPDTVTFIVDGNDLELQVGGLFSVMGEYTGPIEEPNEAKTAADKETTSDISGNSEAEILKKMMERRQKELGR